MEDKVILLDYHPSMFGMRARVALAVKGIDYEHREEDLQNKSQLLLESNPVYKQIPVLIHNGKPVCGSFIIVEYIDEVWKDKSPTLLPCDPYQRAQARFLADYIEKKVMETGNLIWCEEREEKEAGKKGFVEFMKQMESELGDKPFFGDNGFGFLDVALITYTPWFKTFEICGDFSIQQDYPKLSSWVKKCLEIESVSKSLADPDNVYNFYLTIKEKRGI
ncbi:probable glutathione S-transferase isoform X2 [Salvia hispanica]|uniref:probable glutathione S-transferase isoform X2 n=1 Tax=Salvia hispanica TaxID=49212 RepID=UPI0020094717|nr:probable glutathione S-transferase isoform X2 [Salvia hispanica]